MSTIVTRSGKGSPLSHVEVDANFTNLNTDKIQSGNTVAALTITSATVVDLAVTGITSFDGAQGTAGQVLTSSGTGNTPTWSNVSITPTAVSDQTNTSTGYFDLPAGTTAQRPVTPATGMIRFNSTETKYEVYTGTSWQYLNTTEYPVISDYLVVAGGGGGGYYAAGGGGAGGYREFTSQSLSVATNYTVTVGAGGASTPGSNGNAQNNGSSGSNSVFGTVTANGGGGGAGGLTTRNGLSGGSGGGGSSFTGGAGTGGAGNTPSTSPSQGNNGADSTISNAGGGGGAGAAASGKNGGNGTASSITGTSVTRAGGGGGYNGGTGGTGGGGANGSGGTVNTGGGAGGDADTQGGGSGVVIIKYPDTFTISNPSGGLTFSTPTPAGGFKVTTFTAGTGNIQLN